MKFIVSSSILLSHLQSVGKVINAKTSLPILECFLIEIKDRVLNITAADSDIRLETSIDLLESDGEVTFAVNAKNLLDPLKELPEQPLTFEVNTENLEIYIYYRNGKYNFIGTKGSEFPVRKELKEDAKTFSIDPETLLSGINRTIFACADDELRPVMNGIFIDLTPENIVMVASDGHKLVKDLRTDVNSSETASFILPRKPANLLKAILLKENNSISFTFDDNNAHLTLENYNMTCRFIEGRYPNYSAVIPKESPNVAVLDRVSFLNAIKRVSVFSNSGTNLIKLQFSNSQLYISAQDLDFSTSADEELNCDYNGSPITIGFKSYFLIEMLNNIPSSEVYFKMSDASRAAVLSPMDNLENEDLLMLLMPMMLND